MVTYEPELMFAYDSKSEYADLKNIYNVTGDDICYCPICLGRVKLWNGQDPNRTYLKQRCFHHIDGMCSQESRIHFAYKTWLLEENSKFKVGDDLYEVKSVKLEQTLKTTYGNYRPDIIIKTVDDKTFYVEIADTNKKTDEYVLKWDELGNDVIEIDVNEQLFSITTKDIPIFSLIYSADTGQCFIKRYIRQDYDEIFTERKLYWKRQDLLNYKIKWERLDWFWLILQGYYAGKNTVEDVCNSFKSIEFEDQKFICSRFKSGKHKQIKYELENYYSDESELRKVKLKHISNVVRSLNKEFGYSTTSCYPYLHRRDNFIIFDVNFYLDNIVLRIDKNTTEKDVYDYFHDKMKNYYELEKENVLKRQQEKSTQENARAVLKRKFNPILKIIEKRINCCKNGLWKMSFEFYNSSRYLAYNSPDHYCVFLRLAKYWEGYVSFPINTIEENIKVYGYENSPEEYFIQKIQQEMNNMLESAFLGKRTVRLLEER